MLSTAHLVARSGNRSLSLLLAAFPVGIRAYLALTKRSGQNVRTPDALIRCLSKAKKSSQQIYRSMRVSRFGIRLCIIEQGLVHAG